ncbi:uncharacterized protein LOC143620597 [Bidens hawaiensis]|uniref:uncharacterized protein LOC143620597 n=1 Tax=Bidens hawaiensis TaxID=980011 RepID=UPI004049DE82
MPPCLQLLSILLLLALVGYSDAAYCVCNTAMSDSVLQKNIDYACGNGADCSQISQNGACFNPNTVKDHCTFAVNSYFQKKGQVPGSCDFSGTASVVQALPAGVNSACFSSTSSPSPPGTGTGTGVGTPPPGTGTGVGTPPIGTGIGVGTPPTGTGTGTGVGTPPPGTGFGTPPTGIGIGTGTGTTGTGTGLGIPSGITPIGLRPTGTNGYDGSGSISVYGITSLLTPASLLVLGFTWFRLI